MRKMTSKKVFSISATIVCAPVKNSGYAYMRLFSDIAYTSPEILHLHSNKIVFQLKADRPRTGYTEKLFCSRDRDLDPMTLIYELDLDIRKTNLQTQSELSRSGLSKVRALQGQYWAGRTPPPNNRPPNMAAANFVVITNGEGCALNGTAVAAVFIDQ